MGDRCDLIYYLDTSMRIFNAMKNGYTLQEFLTYDIDGPF